MFVSKQICEAEVNYGKKEEWWSLKARVVMNVNEFEDNLKFSQWECGILVVKSVEEGGNDFSECLQYRQTTKQKW